MRADTALSPPPPAALSPPLAAHVVAAAAIAAAAGHPRMAGEGDVLLLDGGIGHLLKERGVQVCGLLLTGTAHSTRQGGAAWAPHPIPLLWRRAPGCCCVVPPQCCHQALHADDRSSLTS